MVYPDASKVVARPNVNAHRTITAKNVTYVKNANQKLRIVMGDLLLLIFVGVIRRLLWLHDMAVEERASKPSLVREGVKFPWGYLSKKAELSSEDAYGIFYGSESFLC